MAAWLPTSGQTLFMPSGPAGAHLFVILNDPVALTGYPGVVCVLVCVCSKYPNVPYDPTCELAPGCHPFVTHDSYVAYRHARIETSTSLATLVAQGVFIPNQPCADPPFSQIKAGLNTSSNTKRAFKNLPI